ncbi:MAG: ATP-binding cassette domain-containing protein [Candidatus Micrarchaeia archaeon]
MPIINIENLTKRYGNTTAVDSLSLEIESGEVFGLLGPNGAGKTTLISMLCTLIKPTSGTATVAGFDICKAPRKVRERIGIVFQEPSVDDMLTGRENLELHGMLYGMPRTLIEERVEEMLSLVGLKERQDDRVSTYSGGMRRRLELARGLMHSPEILFLDEPTLGLDPASRKNIWDYIKRLAGENGTTIVLTTHYMEEADMLCDRVGIIDNGKLIALGKANELKKTVGEDIVRLKGHVDERSIAALPFVKKFEKKFYDGEEYAELIIENAAANLQELLGACGKLESVEVRAVTLNDVFLRFTGKEIREGDAEGSWAERVFRFGDSRG